MVDVQIYFASVWESLDDYESDDTNQDSNIVEQYSNSWIEIENEYDNWSE
mgnify:CR=1 FL=1